MCCTWKNTKCRKSKTKISTLKNRPIVCSENQTLREILQFKFKDPVHNKLMVKIGSNKFSSINFIILSHNEQIVVPKNKQLQRVNWQNWQKNFPLFWKCSMYVISCSNFDFRIQIFDMCRTRMHTKKNPRRKTCWETGRITKYILNSKTLALWIWHICFLTGWFG